MAFVDYSDLFVRTPLAMEGEARTIHQHREHDHFPSTSAIRQRVRDTASKVFSFSVDLTRALRRIEAVFTDAVDVYLRRSMELKLDALRVPS